jgi:hypothetical protein
VIRETNHHNVKKAVIINFPKIIITITTHMNIPKACRIDLFKEGKGKATSTQAKSLSNGILFSLKVLDMFVGGSPGGGVGFYFFLDGCGMMCGIS